MGTTGKIILSVLSLLACVFTACQRDLPFTVDGSTGIPSDHRTTVGIPQPGQKYVEECWEDYTLVTTWGHRGDADGEFNRPWGLAVDPSGNLYVTDLSNDRVQHFATDGTFLAKWGSFGNGDGQFDTPTGVAVDRSGSVYVADLFNHRIQKFTSDGVFIHKWGSRGSGNGQFNLPQGVAVDRLGNVYVADNSNHRIRKFGPVSKDR